MNKGFIFDLDGVIVDTAKFHFLAWSKIANLLGFEFSIAQNEALKGVSRMRSLELLLSIGGVTKTQAEKEALAYQKNKIYLQLIENLTQADLLPGVLQFLQNSKEEIIKIALGSASKNAAFILKKLGIAHLFDARVDGTMVNKAKPHPEVFTKAAQLLGIAPNNCLVFEDAEAGVLAAKNAGMKCIGIGNNEHLNKADKIISGLDKITVNQAINLLNN